MRWGRVELKHDLVVQSQNKKHDVSLDCMVNYSRRDKHRSMKVEKLESRVVQSKV